MTRGEWHQQARDLAAQGVGVREIGRRIGVSHTAVSKVLNPERTRKRRQLENARYRGRKRQWDASPNGRGVCERCGGLKGIGSTYSHALCSSCFADKLDEDARKFIALWNAGLTAADIAESVGMCYPKSVYVRAFNLRSRGYVLAERRRGRKRVAAA
jgi:hypothetical protein